MDNSNQSDDRNRSGDDFSNLSMGTDPVDLERSLKQEEILEEWYERHYEYNRFDQPFGPNGFERWAEMGFIAVIN